MIAGRRAAFGSVPAIGSMNGKRRGWKPSIAVDLGFVLVASCQSVFSLAFQIASSLQTWFGLV